MHQKLQNQFIFVEEAQKAVNGGGGGGGGASLCRRLNPCLEPLGRIVTLDPSAPFFSAIMK